ncbi:hypothetical protein AXF42_Ash019156 [Apostasia shenzhenica]|uniref:GIR1-like zinc ribbon domain-containing protein n=1 Tax=Apostasia shenzhenica TaxID=1088818 RepID=A0A2I0B2D1_9ASPA|nr:hypothetical protein AXF42_Ash019156 [Apostasia shenzhenica]
MAVDVSSLIRIMEAYREEAEGKRRDLFTRDLLGTGGGGGGGSPESSAAIGYSKELDLDLHVPSGWERRLDLMTGKTYLQRIDSDQVTNGIQDLNLPPPASSGCAAPLPENSTLLDLKLAGASSVTGPCSFSSRGEYQSVCTLEKVKSALQRAGRVPGGEQRVFAESASASASPSSSTTSSSMKRRAAVAVEDDDGSDSTGGMMAAACPSCLLYVLISKSSPRCPRCDLHVPIPFASKKPKFDLNIS